MAGIDQQIAQAHLDKWLAADLAVANGQSYEMSFGNEDRKLTRADAKEIRENISYWQTKINKLSRGGIRVRGITPVDG